MNAWRIVAFHSYKPTYLSSMGDVHSSIFLPPLNCFTLVDISSPYIDGYHNSYIFHLLFTLMVFQEHYSLCLSLFLMRKLFSVPSTKNNYAFEKFVCFYLMCYKYIICDFPFAIVTENPEPKMWPDPGKWTAFSCLCIAYESRSSFNSIILYHLLFSLFSHLIFKCLFLYDLLSTVWEQERDEKNHLFIE